MPSVAISIDSRGAEQGAAAAVKSFDAISKAAERAAQSMERAQKLGLTALQGGQGAAAQVAAVQKVGAAEKVLEADRARAAREQTRRDAERLRSQQQLERQLLTLRSTFGGAERGAAQFARGLQTLDAALARGIINTAEYTRLLAILRERTTLASVNSRDLRLNMLAMSQSFTGLAGALGIAIPGMTQFAAATAAVSAASKAGFVQLSLLAGIVSGSAVVFAGLVAGAVKSADALDDLADTADAIGISVRSLQELRFVALTAGVENVDAAITRFANRLGELKQGSESLNPTLQTLGLSFRDLIGLNVDEALNLIADRMKGVEDPTLRTAATIDLFGKTASRMTNILSGGADELERTRRLAHALRVVIDDETIEAGKRLSDNLSILGAVIKSVGIQITDFLLAPLASFVEHATKAIAKTEELNHQFAAGLSLQQTREEIRKTSEEIEKLTKFSDPGETGGFAGKALQERLGALKTRLAELTQETKAHATATVEQNAKVNELIEAMRIEVALGTLSSRQRAISTAVLKAGSAATVDQIEAIKQLAAVLFDQEQALKRTTDATKKQTAAETELHDAHVRTREKFAESIADQIQRSDQQAVASFERANEQREAEAKRAGEEQARLMFEPIRNAIEGIQRSLADAFFDVFDGATDSAKSFAKNLLDLMKRTAAEIASALVIELVLGGVTTTGVGGRSSGGGSTMSGIIGQLLGGGGSGGGLISSLLSGIFGGGQGGGGGLLGSLLGNVFGTGGGGGSGGLLGVAGGLLVKAGSSLSTISSTLGQIVTGLGGLLGGTAAAGLSLTAGVPGLSAAGVAALAEFGVGASAAGIGAAGGTGFAGGAGAGGAAGGLAGGALGASALSLYLAGIVASVFGVMSLNKTLQQRFQGRDPFLDSGGFGGSAVQGIMSLSFGTGGIIDPIVGAIIGLVKHAAAKLDKLQLRTAPEGSDAALFQNSQFAQGPFGLVGLSDTGTTHVDTTNARVFAETIRQLDETIAEFLNEAQVAAVAAKLQATPALQEKFRAFDHEMFQIVADRLNTIFAGVFGDQLSDTFVSGRGKNKNLFLLQEQLAVAAGGLAGSGMTEAFVNAALEYLERFNQFNAALDEIISNTEGGASEAAKAIKALNEQLDQLKFVAEEQQFGAATLAKVEEVRIQGQAKLREGFATGIEDQILAITNPFVLAQRELERQQAERRRNAIDFEADLTRIAELEQLERVALAKETLTSIKAMRDAILAGPASFLSPAEQLATTETRFNEQLALIQAGNLSGVNAFVQTAALLRDLRRERDASGPMFQEFETFLLATLESILGQVPGFATQGAISAGSDSQLLRIQPSETAQISRGPLPNPIPVLEHIGRDQAMGNQRIVSELERLNAKIDQLVEENAELRAQQRRLLNELPKRAA